MPALGAPLLAPRGALAPRRAAAAVALGSPATASEVAAQIKKGSGGPSPDDPQARLQVVVYRGALLLSAMCWSTTYTLDFFMTSGINIIDGSVQSDALTAADLFAGIAAIAAPTGSRVLAGVLLRLLGTTALASVALGAAGATPGALVAAAGPACLVVVCAREIFWFGLWYKYDAAWAVVLFAAIGYLRVASALDPLRALAPMRSGAGGLDATMQLLKQNAIIQESDVLDFANAMQEVQPVGPPVFLSFFASVVLFVLAAGKLFEPIGEDIDEAGEQWQKQSSRSLYDDVEEAKALAKEAAEADAAAKVAAAESAAEAGGDKGETSETA